MLACTDFSRPSFVLPRPPISLIALLQQVQGRLQQRRSVSGVEGYCVRCGLVPGDSRVMPGGMLSAVISFLQLGGPSRAVAERGGAGRGEAL